MDVSIPPSLQWPFQFFVAITAAVFILSVLTGNVSQVDRVWTFLPWIYTAYFALLPLWPRNPVFPLFPYTPAEVTFTDMSPRSLLLLGLVVSYIPTRHVRRPALIRHVDALDDPVCS
jgi:hypothetical protein